MLFILTLTGGLDDFCDRNILKHIWPALTISLPVLIFLCPYDTLTYPFFGVLRHGFKQRLGLLYELGATFATPFTYSTFKRRFIADVLCSMPKVFTDLQYTLCLYSTGLFWDTDTDDYVSSPHFLHGDSVCGSGDVIYIQIQAFLGVLPFWLRFCQCCRAYYDKRDVLDILNAIKYLLSLSVQFLATVRSLTASDTLRQSINIYWGSIGAAATIYSFYWDVVMDW
jgi:hypothetical protein